MFRSFRFIAIALGLALSIVQSFAQEGTKPALKGEPITESRQEQSTPTSQNNTTKKQPKPPSFVTAIEGVERAIRDLIAEEDKIERERKQDQEIRDLNAQEGMAIWAERMFWATVATVFLTFVALVAIIRTLHHTRRAADASDSMVREARATTSAALQSVAEARETAARQLRPYVTVESIVLSREAPAQTTSRISFLKAPTLVVKVANGGQTPAESLSYIVESVAHVGRISNRDTVPENVPRGAPKGILGPSLIQNIPAKVPFTEKSLGGLVDAVILVKGRIKYSDDFAKQRTLKFAYWSRLPNPNDRSYEIKLQPCNYGNSTT